MSMKFVLKTIGVFSILVMSPLIQQKLFGQQKLFSDVEISAGPNFTSLFHKENQNSQIKESFEGGLGYEVQTLIGMQLTKKIKLLVGLKYISAKYNYKIDGIVWGPDIINGTTSNYNTKVWSDYIGVPIKLNFGLLEKENLVIELSSGVGFFRGFSKKVNLYNSEELISSAASSQYVHVPKNNFLAELSVNIYSPIINDKILLFGGLGSGLLLNKNIHKVFVERDARLFFTKLIIGLNIRL